jgi:hypothetical protein
VQPFREQSHEEGENGVSEIMEISNEFAFVQLKKRRTRNGVVLEIYSPKLGRSIRLDALSLESLTWQDSEVFTKFLETPYGP